jgi:hypothetical protein
MPRRTVEAANTEDLMSDSAAEEWETVSEGYGQKILWSKGYTFTGTFDGTREVPLDDSEDGFSTAPAASFTDSAGQKYWCWLPYQLKESLTPDMVGAVVRITCTGEETTKRGLNPVKTFTIQRKIPA